MTRAEVEDALAPVRKAFDEFRKTYSIQAAYFKCTRRFYDAIYDTYTYPMVSIISLLLVCCKLATLNKLILFQKSEKYRLRKLRAADGRSQVLEAITCPSSLDLSDSDCEEPEAAHVERPEEEKETKDANNNEESTSDSFSHDNTGIQDVGDGDQSESEDVCLYIVCRKFAAY